MRIEGNPGCFTSSYALGRLIPICMDSSCTLIVVLSILFTSCFLGIKVPPSGNPNGGWVDLFENKGSFASGPDLQNGIVCGQIFYTTRIATIQQFFFRLQLPIFPLFFAVFHIVYLLISVKWVDCPYQGPGNGYRRHLHLSARETPFRVTSAEHRSKLRNLLLCLSQLYCIMSPNAN